MEKTVNVFIKNNTLKKSVLKEYFPEGGNLTYKISDETYLLDADEMFIYTNPSIDV